MSWECLKKSNLDDLTVPENVSRKNKGDGCHDNVIRTHKALKSCKIDDLMTIKSENFPNFVSASQISDSKQSHDLILKCEIEDINVTKSQELRQVSKFKGKSVDISKNHNEEKLENVFESDEEIWEQLSVLRILYRREKELNSLILYEKLKCITPEITDEKFLKASIAEFHEQLQRKKTDQSLKEMMSSNCQLINISQEIKLFCEKKDISAKQFEYMGGKKGLVSSLILKKKQLNREISLQQKEILKIEEECHELRMRLESALQSSMSITMQETSCPNNHDFKRLEKENKTRNSSIQLLAKITQCLVEGIGTKNSLSDDMKLLSSACEKIKDWNYDDIDQMNDLCTNVYKTKI